MPDPSIRCKLIPRMELRMIRHTNAASSLLKRILALIVVTILLDVTSLAYDKGLENLERGVLGT